MNAANASEPATPAAFAVEFAAGALSGAGEALAGDFKACGKQACLARIRIFAASVRGCLGRRLQVCTLLQVLQSLIAEFSKESGSVQALVQAADFTAGAAQALAERATSRPEAAAAWVPFKPFAQTSTGAEESRIVTLNTSLDCAGSAAARVCHSTTASQPASTGADACDG